MNISITVHNAQVVALMQQLKAKIVDLTPVMNEIGQRYRASVLHNWANQSSPDGTPWQKLSATTLMIRLSQKSGSTYKNGTAKRPLQIKSGYLSAKGKGYLQNKQILVESGEMRKRVHAEPGKDSVTIGIAGIPYAAIHQFGGKAGRNKKVNIPARPWLARNKGESLELADKDLQMVVDVLTRHLA